MGKRNVFDILGPIMVGPSSSHMAGAVRLGAMARRILDEEPTQGTVLLHGSFAKTDKGHGTHLAAMAAAAAVELVGGSSRQTVDFL